MALYKKGTNYQMDVNSLIKKFKRPISQFKNIKTKSGSSVYDDTVTLFQKFLDERDHPKNSYLKFGMIFGDQSERLEKADEIWEYYSNRYNADQDSQALDFVKKLLGIILMITVAQDEGEWEYEPDPDKQLKLGNQETPDATIYNLRKPK